MTIEKLAKQWDANARQWDAQANRINRSKCNDGERNLRKGMAIVARQCAEDLREAMKEVPDVPLVDVSNIDSEAPQYTEGRAEA